MLVEVGRTPGEYSQPYQLPHKPRVETRPRSGLGANQHQRNDADETDNRVDGLLQAAALFCLFCASTHITSLIKS